MPQLFFQFQAVRKTWIVVKRSPTVPKTNKGLELCDNVHCAAAPPQLLPQQSQEHSKTTGSQSRRGSISKNYLARLFQCISCKLLGPFQVRSDLLVCTTYALFRILARKLRCFRALHHKCNYSTRPVERHLESGLGGTSPPMVALRACKEVILFFSKLFNDVQHEPVQQACQVSLG